MRRLARILALVAALGCGAALGNCAFFHGDYPPSNGECKKNTDCLFGELCGDGGVCVASEQTDAGAEDGKDGGGQ